MRLCNCAENLYGRSIKVNEIGFFFSFNRTIEHIFKQTKLFENYLEECGGGEFLIANKIFISSRILQLE